MLARPRESSDGAISGAPQLAAQEGMHPLCRWPAPARCPMAFLSLPPHHNLPQGHGVTVTSLPALSAARCSAAAPRH